MSNKIYGIPVGTPMNPAKIDPAVSADKIASSVASYMENNPITPSSIGARPDSWMPTAEQVGARPNTWTPTAEEVGARPNDWLPTIAEIGAAPAPLNSSITLQVSTAGNDTTGDGTSAKPYATIQKALDTLPKNLGGYSVTINIGVGSFTGFSMQGFYNGFITVIGASKSTTHIINSGLNIGLCSAKIDIEWMHIAGTSAGYGINVHESKNINVTDCLLDGTTSVGGILVNETVLAVLRNVTINDKTLHALSCPGSMVLAYGLTGSNNNVGIVAGNSNAGLPGLIVCNPIGTMGTTNYSKVLGGAIIMDGKLV